MTYGPNASVIDGKYYRTLVLINDQLFVGGKAQLFSVDTADLTMLDYVSIPTTVAQTCDYCNNYIRVIHPLLNSSVLLECGTNSKHPYCQQRSIGNLSDVESRFSLSTSESIVPFTHNQNSSGWFLTEDLDLFVGTKLELVAGSLARPAIVKSMLQNDSSQNVVGIEVQLKTKNDASVLSNNGPPHPEFVGDPINYNGHVYFFFREIATEFVNERVVYSRVAVVCQNDTGGRAFSNVLLDTNLATFTKTRLTCFIQGDEPYHYNEIQDIYQSPHDINVIFAVFATRAPGLASSAVCAYRMDDIELLFKESKFTHQESDGMLWTSVNMDPTDPRLVMCPDTSGFSDVEFVAILGNGQILYTADANNLHYENPITSTPSNPLLVIDGERFSQIVVDENVFSSTDVMFIGTENGTVLKAYLNGDRSEARVVEEISLNTNDHVKTPVLTMLLSDSAQAVFVGTDHGIYKIPFQHCQDYATCQSCLDARDPYCSWKNEECVHSGDGLQALEDNCARKMCPDFNADSELMVKTRPSNLFRSLNITNQPLNMYLVAQADVKENLLVVDDEIRCPPCASLPYTEHRSISSSQEFLMLLINGSSTENMNCSCSIVLATECVTKTINFTITADNSPRLNLAAEYMDVLSKYDNDISKYEQKLNKWIQKKYCMQDELNSCERCL
ncbi:semaphorin-5B-like [Patiria miniata]|uniref:Sema domain-containing protein n=1 Tax=Patiria miniata TaxID=46514 RepID=A0A914BE47_PATMI|nr:semaphorin-5B-like [Patiria miniata]